MAKKSKRPSVPKIAKPKKVIRGGKVYSVVQKSPGILVAWRDLDVMDVALLDAAAKRESQELTTAQVVTEYAVDRRHIRRLKNSGDLIPIAKRRKSHIWARADLERIGLVRK